MWLYCVLDFHYVFGCVERYKLVFMIHIWNTRSCIVHGFAVGVFEGSKDQSAPNSPQGVPVPEILASVSLFVKLKHLPKYGDMLARRNNTDLFMLLTFATHLQ